MLLLTAADGNFAAAVNKLLTMIKDSVAAATQEQKV